MATQGAGGDDEGRLVELLRDWKAQFYPFDRSAKGRSFWGLIRAIVRGKPDVVVMEGTGIFGGAALMLCRRIVGIPYVISSGDAVGPFIGLRHPFLRPIFGLYERLLCRWSAGFVGWSPYLAGRAMTFGAPRAMTAPGWAPFPLPKSRWSERRALIRARLGLSETDLVIGIVGSLAWVPRYKYCYGMELVRSLRSVTRGDAKVLIVGDGEGSTHLKREAGDMLGRSILMTGRVPRAEVADYLAAMDVASLSQSCDAVGSFRYTTKISEYLAAGLPIITGQLPFSYDLDDGWLWRLAGNSPWDERYIKALAELIDRIKPDELETRRLAVPVAHPLFDRDRQVAQVTDFLVDLLNNQNSSIA